MADDSDILGRIGTAGSGIFLRNLMERVLEQLMDFEVTSGIQAGRYEQSGSPPDLPEWVSGTTAAHAAGYAGVAGTEAAAGELFSVILEPPPTRGTGTDGGHPGSVDRRDVDAQSRRTGSKALGMTGITKSQVSALCRDIDERVKSFLERPPGGRMALFGWTPPI